MSRTTVKARSDIEQVWHGIQLVCAIVIGLFTMILLAYGLAKFRSPEVDTSLFTFLKGYPPRVIGTVCIMVALAILWITVRRWATFLPGLFAYAVFGGLIAVGRGGISSPIAALQLTRYDAAVMTLLYALCAFLTMGFAVGKLHWTERSAAMGAPLLIAYAATSNSATAGLEALVAMVIIFGATAAYNRLRLRHRS